MDKDTTHNDEKNEIKKVDKSTQTESTSQSIQSNPPIQNQPQENVLKRRRALEDRRQRCGEPCYFILNNNDLKDLEQALKCRLITRVEYQCLKLRRELVETEGRLYNIKEILKILANEEKDNEPSPSTAKTRNI
ncbi:unnamed protein product [Pieris macdunnoughi]|uniref:Uncharacterized protein n=1 Tax=Pieris macdunnoughi TaxID=345717 RepID=A0A821L2H4_9NEOP|nr:unnamed protein product [Pieris macdunnoughi]